MLALGGVDRAQALVAVVMRIELDAVEVVSLSMSGMISVMMV